MKKILSLGTLCALLVLAPLAVHADPIAITGAFAVTFDVTGTNGTGANTSLSPPSGVSEIDFADAFKFGGSQGVLGGVPNLTTTSGSLALFTGAGTKGGSANGSVAFTLTFGNYGTFTETVDPLLVSSSANGTTTSANYYLLGTFTPGVFFTSQNPGYTVNPGGASLIIGFTNNGTGSYSGSGTLTTPAVILNPVPEPSSLALLGTGILGGVGMLRRRFKA